MTIARLETLVRDIVKDLVDKEDEARVVPAQVDRLVLFTVTCAKADFGKLIGRSGANADALRTIVRAAGRKYRLDAFLSIVDSNGVSYRPVDPEFLNAKQQKASKEPPTGSGMP